MRFLLGWTVKLGFLAVVYLTMTGNLKVQLPETLLGYEVPVQARAALVEFAPTRGRRAGPAGAIENDRPPGPLTHRFDPTAFGHRSRANRGAVARSPRTEGS